LHLPASRLSAGGASCQPRSLGHIQSTRRGVHLIKMADLSDRDVEDIIGGQQPVGRDDLANVVELTTWMHASRDLEPAPPMNDGLFWQVGDGMQAPTRSSRRPPAHLRAGSRRRPSWARAVGGRPDGQGGVSLRPTLSLAAAAVLLVALLTAVYHGGSAQQPSTVGSPSAADEIGQGDGASVNTGARGSTSTASTPATTTSTTLRSTSVAPSTGSGPAGVGRSTAGPVDVHAPSADAKATDKAPGEGGPPTKGDKNDADGERRDDGDRQDDAEASAESPWWTLDDLPWWPLVAEQLDEPDTSDTYGEFTEGDAPGDDGRRGEDASVEEPKAG
jgi:hypothetical protein